MKNRKNYLRARKKRFKWEKIGYLSKERVCPKCGENSMIFIDKYDAWACISCFEWLEKACGDPKCPFCSIRPKTPYDVYWMNELKSLSYGVNKRWRCDNYQHKTNGMVKHKRKRIYYNLWKEAQEEIME